MTITSAFNDITVAKGGTPSESGTIAGAIDALNDTLAGSGQPASDTIEGAIKRLGENIGGGGGYDLAIKITKKDGSNFDKTGYQLDIIGGGYDAVYEKIQSDIAPVISVMNYNLNQDGKINSFGYATVTGVSEYGVVTFSCPLGAIDNVDIGRVVTNWEWDCNISFGDYLGWA